MMNLQRSDFDYWSAINTRWRDMDALGHLNHAIYLEYMET
ncbi:MAG TPA: acyl-CoA thioesterase, partial [Candidatus Marinimicrobia bacterium]|nr:acyl-CoA thioesterase [Candidatus Neomarinimicrobiota bacterium]